MTDFFTSRRKTIFRIAGATAILGIAGQCPLSAQSPTEPRLVEAARLDRAVAGGVLAPPCIANFNSTPTGDGRRGSISPKNLPQAATDGRGGQPEDASDTVEPDDVPGLAFVP